MTPETLLTAALSASTPLFALVAARIYPGAFPEKTPYPGIVYSRAGTEFVSTIHGTLIAEDADFSVQAWAATRTTSARTSCSSFTLKGRVDTSLNGREQIISVLNILGRGCRRGFCGWLRIGLSFSGRLRRIGQHVRIQIKRTVTAERKVLSVGQRERHRPA